MGINEIYNLSNISQANKYLNVYSANAEKQTQAEGGLFQFNTNQQQNQNLLLMPSSNEYDDEFTTKNKEGSRLNFLI